jgi:hypothetical protein
MRKLNQDIRAWSPAEREYLDALQSHMDDGAGKSGPNVRWVKLDVDSCRVYALCKLFVAEQPNGFYTFVRRGMPLDNIVWWDFVLTCGDTILHIIRTAHILEARVYDTDLTSLDFDPERFLTSNLSALAPVVTAQVDDFERHTVHLNHYHSYRSCAEWLWTELGSLQLDPPTPPNGHIATKEELEAYFEAEKAFVGNSHKFHVLGKSLVLHLAFMAEACLNTLFRVGAAPPLRVSAPAMKHLLRANFREKLRLVRACSIVFATDPDMANPTIKAALDLMELRNKYVHADESSLHNMLGEVRFDGDFPLHPVSGFTPGVDFALRVLHRPDRTQLAAAYNSAHDFCRYMVALVRPAYRDDMQRFLDMTQIGFNHSKGVYSSVYVDSPFTFFLHSDPENEGA